MDPQQGSWWSLRLENRLCGGRTEQSGELGSPSLGLRLLDPCGLWPADVRWEFSRGRRTTVGPCGQML